MTEKIWQESLPVGSVYITNPSMDQGYIDFLVDCLKSGLIKPRDLEPIYVKREPREQYFANDGNHRLAAFKLAGIDEIKADIYTLDE